MRQRLAALLLGLLGLAGSARSALSESGSVKVVLFQRGRQHPVAGDSPAGRKLVAECEHQLESANDLLRLAVSPSRLDGLRDKEWVVEVTFAQARVVQSPFGRSPLRVRRLLIPLSGDLAGPLTTIFYGDAQYVSGPYRNDHGTGKLVQLAAELGFDVH